MLMTETQKRIYLGTIYAVVAGVFWGVSGIFGQLFFSTYHANALWITSFRLIIAGIILLLIAYKENKNKIFDVFREKKNYPLFLFYSFGGVFSVQFFYYFCIQLSNSATATILQYTAPVFILLYLVLFKGKKAKLKSFLLVFAAMIGVFLLITNGNVSRLSISPLAFSQRLLY